MRGSAAIPLCILLVACASAPPRPPQVQAQRPAEFPAQVYDRAAARGEPVYRVESQDSELVVLVGRTGSLAKLGHDHAIAARGLGGEVLSGADPTEDRADLYLALESLELDDTALRRKSGLEGDLTPEEIAQTRAHMLQDELHVERHPWVTLHATWAPGTPPRTVLQAALTLNGVTRPLRIPVEYRQGPDRLEVSGQLSIRQSDFGLTPYSALGGALAVDDTLRLSFRIRAVRRSP